MSFLRGRKQDQNLDFVLDLTANLSFGSKDGIGMHKLKCQPNIGCSCLFCFNFCHQEFKDDSIYESDSFFLHQTGERQACFHIFLITKGFQPRDQ